MKLEGSYTFDAPRDLVWEMFLDPEVLARVMPGCQKLERVGQDEYEGKLKIKVGPVQGLFKGHVQLSDLEPPHTYTMAVKGKGPSGIVDGTGQVRLEQEGHKTIMYYRGDAKVSGKIASVGQRLMDSSAKAITKQSLENLDKQIQARQAAEAAPAEEAPAEEGAAAPAPAPVEAPPPPSQTEFAMGVAKEMAGDMLKDDRQKFLLAGLTAVVLFLFINWWTNIIARRVADILKEEKV